MIKKVHAYEQERGENIIAVAVTGAVADVDRDRAIAAGFQAYISKPFELEALVMLMANLVHQSGQTT